MRKRPDPRVAKTQRAGAWLVLIALAASAGLASCGDGGPAEPDVQEPEGTAPPSPPSGLVVSEVVYISASPGTFPDGESVRVTNLANGDFRATGIVDGGFDPIAITGSPDDELEIAVRNRDGSTTVFRTTVPTRKRPRVVRTQPTKDATDVVLRSTVVVVFSEPVDENTITPETVKLVLDGQPVEGTLTLTDDGLRAEFTPAEALAPESVYTLVITTGVRDLAGDPLEEQVEVSFTTEGPPPAPSALTATTVDEVGIDLSWTDNSVNEDGFKIERKLGPQTSADPFVEIAQVSADVTSFSDFGLNPETEYCYRVRAFIANGDSDFSNVGCAATLPPPKGHSDVNPAWSADGSKIAFTRFGDIHTLTADGTGQIAFASDRDADVPGGEETHIYIMNADGTGVVHLPNDTGAVRLAGHPALDSHPTWSPDGSKIAFNSNRHSAYDDPDGCFSSNCDYDIYVMNADGTDVRRLTRSLAWDLFPAWSPDGSKIAFSSTRDGNWEIYTINPDGTGLARLTNSPDTQRFPDWSPDGSKIAFEHRISEGAPSDIYVMNADGTGVARVTTHAGPDLHPAWSPDGSKIAFRTVRDSDGGQGDIYVINADGTEPVRLTVHEAWDFNPTWRP